MFYQNRFTERAQQALAKAQGEAARAAARARKDEDET